MIKSLAIFTLILPFLGFLINGFIQLNNIKKNISGIIGTLIIFVTFLISVYLFSYVSNNSGIEIEYFNWIAASNFNINFGINIDEFSTWMMLIITGIGTLIHLYSIGYMNEDKDKSKFFSYLNLFIFSMLILVMSNNLVFLFFGWEAVGLCSYLLIGFWYTNIEYGHAARKAFIMNRIGDLGIILAIFLIFKTFGTLNFLEIAELANSGLHSKEIINLITILLFVGAIGKSAQIPLFTWLPDAMAGPTPVSALIHAATMVTAGIYLIVRNASLFELSLYTKNIILVISLLTIIISGIIAIYQNDIKKILAYSTVSQLGFMFFALSIGAYSTAAFHMTTHAFFKALLFLGAGSIIHACSGEQNIDKMGGLKEKLPITFYTFFIGVISIIGFPFTSGFFSKDEILEKAFEHSQFLWILLIFGSILTAIYMLRMFFVVFYGLYNGSKETEKKIHESPKTITIPLIILSILSLLGGILNFPKLINFKSEFLAQRISKIPSLSYISSTKHHLFSHNTELVLMIISSIIVITMIIIVKSIYSRKDYVVRPNNNFLSIIGQEKFYFDEIYNFLIIKPTEKLSDILYQVEKRILRPLFDIFNTIINYFGKSFQNTSDGNIESYLLYFVVSIVFIFWFIFKFI